MIALPTQLSYERDQAQQPPNTATDQHSRLKRTTKDISADGRSQDADQLAHGLHIVDSR